MTNSRPNRAQRFYPYWGAGDAESYELLNRCTDPEGRLEALLQDLAPMDGRVVLDVGAGSGYHAARYAARSAHVYAVEPDPGMLQQMHARLSQEPCANISVLAAGAEDIPLREGCIHIAHARFAYFFGDEACVPGIAQVKRLLAPGGHFLVIDTNPDQGQFGELARQAYPEVFHPRYVPDHVAFYARYGFEHHVVHTTLRAPTREALARVLRADFPRHWPELLAQVNGSEMSYALSVFHLRQAQGP